MIPKPRPPSGASVLLRPGGYERLSPAITSSRGRAGPAVTSRYLTATVTDGLQPSKTSVWPPT